MTAIVDNLRIPKFADIYPPYAEKLGEYMQLSEMDPSRAETLFSEAQEIYRAFHAGIEYAERQGRR